MFFKKRVPVEEYCAAKLAAVFSPDFQTRWEAIRRNCNDEHLARVPENDYLDNIRAIIIELFLIAIGRTCKFEVSSDARVFVMYYLQEHDLSRIHALAQEYS